VVPESRSGGVHPTQSIAKKGTAVDNDHQLGRLREAAHPNARAHLYSPRVPRWPAAAHPDPRCVHRAPVALLSAMPSYKRRNVSNFGMRAAKFSAATEELATVGPGADAMISDDEDAAAADDEAGSDIDGTRSSEEEDEDDNYKDGDDYEDEPDGGGSKITSWVQRVYEAGSTLEKYMLSLLGITPFPRPTPTPHARLLPLRVPLRQQHRAQQDARRCSPRSRPAQRALRQAGVQAARGDLGGQWRDLAHPVLLVRGGRRCCSKPRA
jgi:hypothetical protein